MDSGRIDSFFDQYFNEAIKRVIDAKLPPHLTYLPSRNRHISNSLKQKNTNHSKETAGRTEVNTVSTTSRPK